MEIGFWRKLPEPFLGLSPMDGVTDSAMRFITKKIGKPEVIFTEFTSAEGIRAGANRLLRDLKYSEMERMVVAQLFGEDPEAFRVAAIVVCALGFDGVDVNMGCPARSVESRGGGAGLIRQPERAKEIINAVSRGVNEWVEGIEIKELELKNGMGETVEGLAANRERKAIPVSLKTRIGYDKTDYEWIKRVGEMNVVAVTLHGRTFKQLYTGQADWEVIAEAGKILRQSGKMVLGNGDVDSRKDAMDKMEKYQVDGVLVGRGAMGNPWVFTNYQPEFSEKVKVMIEHARKFEELFPGEGFLPMRKHLAWYVKGIDGAKELRQKLVQCNSSVDVEETIREFI